MSTNIVENSVRNKCNNPYIHQEVEGNSSSAAHIHEQLTIIAAFCEYYKIIYFCLCYILYLSFMVRKLLKLTRLRHSPLHVWSNGSVDIYSKWLWIFCITNHLKMATNRGRNMYCKTCTIKRAPTFVAYGGFYNISWYTRNRMHNPMIKFTNVVASILELNFHLLHICLFCWHGWVTAQLLSWRGPQEQQRHILL
jgi:NADH:ubiquinone oxidoreductase subunit H